MMRSRRGQAAEVPPERVFGRLWGRMTDQGWRVMAKPHWFARGDPRTWIYCAPEVLDAAGKLRRDAGELGESIFLDKDDLWTWAQRSGWALPADDDDDATGDREGSPSSADEPDDAAAPTSEHHYYRLCIDHHNRLDASRVEARALAAEAATVPEHVLLSPQSPEAPASAKWKEDDRIEAFCRKDMARYYPGTVHEVNVDGTYAVIFDGEKYRDDSPPYLYDADVLEDHIRELADAPATDEPAPAAPVTAAALPPPGTRVAVRFDDGQDYGGTIGDALDERSATCQFDDGTSDVIRFPDQDVRVLRAGDNATARPPPPPESRVEVLFDDRWYAGTVVGGALDEHRATVFFDADGLSQVINFAETGIRVLGTTGELGVGARVALGGKAGKVVELGKRGWWSVRLEGESTLRSARAGKLTVLGRKILVLTAGGRVATILERKQRGWFAVVLDGNVNDEGGAFERKSMRRPMFAPGQDALLDRAFESAPSQQSKRPQAGAPEERAAQRQRFER